MRIAIVAAVVCAACAGGPRPQQSQPAVPHGNISGRWQYDAQASRVSGDTGATGEAQREGEQGGEQGTGRRRFGGGFGGRRGGGERGGGMAGGDRARPRGEGSEGMRETMRLVWEAAQVLQISQTDSTVTLVRPEAGDTVLFKTDGSTVKARPERGPAIATTTLWQGGQLFVEREVDGGGRVTEIYAREPNDPRLYVGVRAEGGRLPRKFQLLRVYDPAAAPGS